MRRATSRAHRKNCSAGAPTSPGTGTDGPLTDDHRQQITDANDQLAREALRVIAVAYRHLDSDHPDQNTAEHDLTFLGLIAMMDPPRPEVIDAVAACRHAGIRIIMDTGDYGVTAEAIARQVGLVTGPDPGVVSGPQLDAMSDEQLVDALATNPEMVFARVRPEHKLRVVAALQHLGQVVAATGDGVNDAPALKQADIGVAMGVTGTDVAREAAVMVLLDDSFASIAASVELGRAVYANIRKFLVYIFSHNIAELAPILLAAASASRSCRSAPSRSSASTSAPTSSPPLPSAQSHPTRAS